MLTKISASLNRIRRVTGRVPMPRLSTLVDAGYSTLFGDSRPADPLRDVDEIQSMVVGKPRVEYHDLVVVTIKLAQYDGISNLPTETLAAALDQLESLPAMCESDAALRVGAKVWVELTRRTQHDRPPRRRYSSVSFLDLPDAAATNEAARLDSTWWWPLADMHQRVSRRRAKR